MTETPTMPNPAEALREDVPKITRGELAALFGPTMPMEVAMFISCTDKTLIEVRKEVYRHALALATPSPPPDEGVPKLTREELAALFGPTMPMEVAMFVSCTDKPLIEVRKEVYRHALALASPVPPDVSGVVDRLRKISKECNPDKLRRYYITEGADVTFHDIFVAATEAATLLLSLASERDSLKRQVEGGRVQRGTRHGLRPETLAALNQEKAS